MLIKQKMLTRLVDQGEENCADPIDVIITAENGYIDIRPVGYGTSNMEDGEGEPVFIELYDGKIMVRIWSDINQEDPTHCISLEDARESRRQKDVG